MTNKCTLAQQLKSKHGLEGFGKLKHASDFAPDKDEPTFQPLTLSVLADGAAGEDTHKGLATGLDSARSTSAAFGWKQPRPQSLLEALGILIRCT